MVLLLLAILCLTLSHMGTAYSLEVDISAAHRIVYEDSHGGFHGDGVTYSQWQFKPQDRADFEAVLAAHPHWQPLPLPDALDTLLDYGFLPSHRQMPATDTGWYYFFNRASDVSDPYAPALALHRPSFNFTLAVYDPASGLLTLLEVDT